MEDSSPLAAATPDPLRALAELEACLRAEPGLLAQDPGAPERLASAAALTAAPAKDVMVRVVSLLRPVSPPSPSTHRVGLSFLMAAHELLVELVNRRSGALSLVEVVSSSDASRRSTFSYALALALSSAFGEDPVRVALLDDDVADALGVLSLVTSRVRAGADPLSELEATRVLRPGSDLELADLLEVVRSL